MEKKTIILSFLLLILIFSGFDGPAQLNGLESTEQENVTVQADLYMKNMELVRESQTRKTRRPISRLFGPLLETTWGQKGGFEGFCPPEESGLKERFSGERFRLGCWSTALAQILYYHRLQPQGLITYDTSSDCTNGNVCHISVSLRSDFDWNKFVNAFESNTSSNSKSEVARYCYYTAAVIQKDFGTGSYMLSKPERAASIADHYNTGTRHYYTGSGDSLGEMESIILNEIKNGHPVMMHIRTMPRKGKDRIYHAVAVDGAGYIANKFIIHINMGHYGNDDGWYNFSHIDDTYNDDAYRRIITIRPKFPKQVQKRKMLDNLIQKPLESPLREGQIMLYYLKVGESLEWDVRVVKIPQIRVSQLSLNLGESDIR